MRTETFTRVRVIYADVVDYPDATVLCAVPPAVDQEVPGGHLFVFGFKRLLLVIENTLVLVFSDQGNAELVAEALGVTLE